MKNPPHNSLWQLRDLDHPIVATAIHDGHGLRDEARRLMKLAPDDRRREEDPYTGLVAAKHHNHVVAQTSRFEVDLNRPRDKAVYVDPADAWGLDIWKQRPDDNFVARSLEYYDAFYRALGELYADMAARHGAFVVFDIHSYNHRRNGPSAPPEDPEANPEINIGTGTMERNRWAGVVDRFIADLRGFELDGRRLDVRENVKFRGGNHAAWTHGRHPDSACVLAIEFKKTFMDEWTGEVSERDLDFICQALEATVDGVVREVGALAK